MLKKIPFNYYLISLPPIFYFLFAFTNKINIGWRHILPIYPFIYVFIAIALFKAYQLLQKKRILIITISILLFFYLICSIMIYPHYLTYFSEAVGGTNQGYKYLLDSNLDWGQDLKKLKKYLDDHNIEHVYLAYMGKANAEYYQINYTPLYNHLAREDLDGKVVAISLSYLYLEGGDFLWLKNYEKAANIGNSIYVYDFR